MIVYLDTSAIVPILVAEPSTEVCRRIWDDADRRVSSQLTYVETSAALAVAKRRGRLTADGYDVAWSNFVQIWPDIDVVHLTVELSSTAAGVARSQGLRANDAVHCASAAVIAQPGMVAAAGDKRLIRAWRSLGVATVATSP